MRIEELHPGMEVTHPVTGETLRVQSTRSNSLYGAPTVYFAPNESGAEYITLPFGVSVDDWKPRVVVTKPRSLEQLATIAESIVTERVGMINIGDVMAYVDDDLADSGDSLSIDELERVLDLIHLSTVRLNWAETDDDR